MYGLIFFVVVVGGGVSSRYSYKITERYGTVHILCSTNDMVFIVFLSLQAFFIFLFASINKRYS